MSALKWERRYGEGMVSSTSVANIDVTAQVGDPHERPRCSLVATSDELGQAEVEAERELLRLYETLREHFDPLPVLRWIDNGDGESIVQNVSGWTLGASHGNWWMEHGATRARAFSLRPNTADAETNRRAAEAALAALGVRFAVEGGER